eukprot:Skav226172  [mRNA]  locus=scaffold1708:48021:49976:- [translate_table: standard]
MLLVPCSTSHASVPRFPAPSRPPRVATAPALATGALLLGGVARRAGSDLEHLTVPMLKQRPRGCIDRRLRDRGLPVSGRKAELLQRLRGSVPGTGAPNEAVEDLAELTVTR